MAQQESMTILQFQGRFKTDEACRDHLYKIRWPSGLTCPKCEGREFYKIKKRNVYECRNKNCRHQVSLTAGTIMHGSHTPLYKWFWAIYLVAQDKRGVSALRLKRELELGSYQTAWTMLHKIRKAMKDRDSEYMLDGLVEMDEAYIGGPTEGGKRGRGTDKTPVGVALSLNKKGNPLYAKMAVVENLKSESLKAFAQESVLEGSTIKSDKYSSYLKAFSEGKYIHQALKYNANENPEHLSWLHKIIGLAKSFIAGTYHGIDKKHLQAYLCEFCFRLNRRRFESQMFNRLLNACMVTSTVTYSDLIHPVPSG